MIKNMKHAYLIIANKNANQLQILLTLLDDSRNDIYLLIDKKSKELSNTFKCNYSNLIYVDPISVYWGNYSLIEAEMRLFKAAAQGHYQYYHLLSGLDLPLTNQDVIHSFFDKHSGKEFLTYSAMCSSLDLQKRLQHRMFVNHYRTKNVFIYLYRKLENQYYNKHLKSDIDISYIGYASQWVSIDDMLLQHILESEKQIQDMFSRGYLVDELFIPTVINMNPEFKDKVYYNNPIHDKPDEMQGNLRYINWWDGKPYTWREKDYTILMKALDNGYFFSRKFDEKIDKIIIDKIARDVLK